MISLDCHTCKKEKGYNLLDCQCLLCDDCFSQHVVNVYLQPLPKDGIQCCSICGFETEMEFFSLRIIPESQHLNVICNYFIVNRYLYLKRGVLEWVAKKEKYQNEKARKIENYNNELETRERIYVKMISWFIAKYDISITDVDPAVLIFDKPRILLDFLKTDYVIPNAVPSFQDQDRTLNDTKKKDSRQLFVCREENPFAQKIAEATEIFLPALPNEQQHKSRIFKIPVSPAINALKVEGSLQPKEDAFFNLKSNPIISQEFHEIKPTLFVSNLEDIFSLSKPYPKKQEFFGLPPFPTI